jgi:2-(1,2-epoxy-1,2-dihydrophenyl)acetyl-CoA isomerase
MHAEDGETVRWLVEPGGVARLTINRPQKGNAISPEERNRIVELLDGASDDPAVRAIVLTGAGDRHFCTGGDLGSPMSLKSASDDPFGPLETVRIIHYGIQRLFRSVIDCNKPTVAAVNGTAAGIGAHLAFACDLVVAADDVTFIEIFVRRGLVPDGAGAYLLTRLVGPHRAKELMFLGDDLPAPDAARLGLVNRAVPRAELESVTTSWAERLAAGPTTMIGLTKGLVNRSLDYDRESALREEAMAVEINSRARDFSEGQRAFLEKRPVRFTGR